MSSQGLLGRATDACLDVFAQHREAKKLQKLKKYKLCFRFQPKNRTALIVSTHLPISAEYIEREAGGVMVISERPFMITKWAAPRTPQD
jgi:hypothetical protein